MRLLRLLSVALLAAAALLASAEDDLYEVLGVAQDASGNQIKRAYRKMSLKYHPDKNPGDDAARATFEKVAHAYEILSDEDKRILYDTGGEKAVQEATANENAPASPFDMFFGGGGGGGQRRNQKKGQDIQAQVQVPLEDMFNGGEVSARISRNVVCRGCSKKPNSKKCRGCGQCPPEIRMVTRQMAPGFNVQMQEEVPSKERCKNEATTLTATVEKGMKNEEQITFERMSEQRPGMIPGDVIFVLKQKEHNLFRREGNDLHMDMHISLKEALVGFNKSIKQLDGREVPITSSGVTFPHQVRTIRGEGMPVHNFPSQSGDLHVKFYVDFPQQLSPEQVEQINNMF